MHSVQLTLPKIIFGIRYVQKKTRMVPEQWNQLTGKQLIRVCRAIDKAQNTDELKCRLIPVLLGIPFSFYFFFTAEQVAMVLWPLTEFILKSNTLTKNLLPCIRMGLRRWYGPMDDLANMTLLEFAYADTYFIYYHRTKDQKWVNLLIGCIYRPADPAQNPSQYSFSGDVRVPFNPYLVEKNARLLSGLNQNKKSAILLWFQGCRQAMEKQYPYVFSERGSGGSSATPWPEFITAMGGGKFGTVNQVGAERIHTVLLDANTFLKNSKKKK